MRVFIICLCFSYAISSIFNLNNNELTLYAKDTLEKTHGKIIHASVVSLLILFFINQALKFNSS